MLDYLFGETVSKILMHLTVFKTAYTREIADNFGLTHSAVQRQLGRLEDHGLLVSRLRGGVRIYEWNPLYPFTYELQALFDKAIRFLPEADRLTHFTPRTRPRRPGKPL